jgi:hypothetical protein
MEESHFMRAIIALTVLLLSSMPAETEENRNDDFENLKKRLTGTWTFSESNRIYAATFETISHGHALLERNSGFIAVYHRDREAIMMTLYTRDGNQPRFRAKGFEGNSIRFVFQDITNWKSGTEHISGLEIFFKDQGHVIEKWETLQPDGTKLPFEFELTRKGDPVRPR